ncbi:MAG: hypothetical protein ABI182_00405 [Candidatus Baltobacteraceae bacterium]
MLTQRHWIPPGALLFAQLSHGVSWVLLVAIGLGGGYVAVSGLALAWIHVVALGWATMAALGILLHVVPAFTDVIWRRESFARLSLVFFAVGVVWFTLSLSLERPSFPAAILLGAAVAVYLTTAFVSLSAAVAGEQRERTTARALAVTLAFLGIAVLLGVWLAAAFSGLAINVPAGLPAAHGHVAIFGWLSLLVLGVSSRTVKPITGNASRFSAIHILVGPLMLFAVPVLAIGLAANIAVFRALGAALLAFALLLYAFDMFDILRRAQVQHRPPQAFMAASVTWLVVSLALGGGIIASNQWQAAYVFVLLVGWIGQMLNAHFYHIGIRLLSTIYRGESDETPPGELLDSRLSWLSFGLFQLAILSGVVGLLTGTMPLVSIAGILGFLSWTTMLANIATARNQARNHIPISPF